MRRSRAGNNAGWLGMAVALAVSTFPGRPIQAELPAPHLRTIFPAGGQSGTEVTVAAEGSSFEGLSAARFADPRLTVEKAGENQFRVKIPANVPAGLYDFRVTGTYGISSPQAFFVSRLTEQTEAEPNDAFDAAGMIPLDCVVNGRVDKPSDQDHFRFEARAGQRVVLECWAARIDSPLRAILELYDSGHRRLAVSRGYAGIDPLIDVRIPADGTYIAIVRDLTYAGSAAHIYRLDVDTGPRVEFAFPPVIERSARTALTLYGRNLADNGGSSAAPERGTTAALPLERMTAAPDPDEMVSALPGLPLAPPRLAANSLAWNPPGGHAPVLLASTDIPLTRETDTNHSPATAQGVGIPAEIVGRLVAPDEQDWYALDLVRGEVVWLEGFGERIGSPVDLDLAILDSGGARELAHFTDVLDRPAGDRFPLAHTDPLGRWVVPASGRYLVLLRNVIGGAEPDGRRVYRLSIRREEPDFHLAAIARRTDQPAATNVWRGGREMIEVVAVRRRGLDGPIRVVAENLPAGIECPPVWLGPGVSRVPLVVTAVRDAPNFAGGLKITGHVDIGTEELVRAARGGTTLSLGSPIGSGRLTDEVALAIAPEAPLVLTAVHHDPVPPESRSAGSEPVVCQRGVLDLAVEIERRYSGAPAPVHLTAIGLPPAIANQVATIPADRTDGWISFAVPASLPPGPYTFAIQGTTEVPAAAVSLGGKGNISVTLVSNPITIRIAEARIALEVDPRAPRRIRRGETIQLNFSTERQHGFIGKIHTELAAPGGLVGLRGRGVTLVGQSAGGTIQIIATENAPLGAQPFLRLEAVGTVEDRPLYRAGQFFELEITE